MGWGSGTTPSGRLVGYAIEGVCDEPGCDTKIDHGLGYLCGMMHGQDDEEGCGNYFCSKHLFYGGPNSMCELCLDAWVLEHPEDAEEDEDE